MAIWKRIKPRGQQTATSELPLVSAQPGQRMRVVSIDGGSSVESRLAELGVFPREEVLLLSRAKRGPLLVMVRGSKLAIGRALGGRVIVEQAT